MENKIKITNKTKIESHELKNKPKIKIGIELECGYNSEVVTLPQGSYHEARKISDFWRGERDGSLDKYSFNMCDFNEDYMCMIELTTPIININDYDKAVEDLKSIFKGEELNKVLCFNKSCGCHIHFSIPEKLYRNVPSIFYRKMKPLFIKELNKSTIIPQETKDTIKQHYTRHYASRFNERHRRAGNRYVEFNFRSEVNGQGMEWRSFNVRNIQTWEQLKEMFKIGTDCIKQLSNTLYNYKMDYYTKFKDETKKESINEEVKLEKYDKSISLNENNFMSMSDNFRVDIIKIETKYKFMEN
jgi:hypothetical protein